MVIGLNENPMILRVFMSSTLRRLLKVSLAFCVRLFCFLSLKFHRGYVGHENPFEFFHFRYDFLFPSTLNLRISMRTDVSRLMIHVFAVLSSFSAASGVIISNIMYETYAPSDSFSAHQMLELTRVSRILWISRTVSQVLIPDLLNRISGLVFFLASASIEVNAHPYYAWKLFRDVIGAFMFVFEKAKTPKKKYTLSSNNQVKII